MQIAEELGKIICYHRKRSGLSRQGLADIAGVGKTVVFDVEKGKETVRLSTLQRILSVLNIVIEFKSPLMVEYRKAVAQPKEKEIR